jgi:hypothetical protein
VLHNFEMRNKSTVSCWVFGYVGFQLLDRAGNALPENLTRSTESLFGRSDPPMQILLPAGTAPLASPGATGHAYFNVSGDDVLCGSVYMNAIASIQIWPPDEYASLVITARTQQGARFVSCSNLKLNPLQVQPHPSFP